jgi:cell division protein ZapE
MWLRASVPLLAGESRIPPRGLYLWGGVGRGKTLLMDLFFASVSERHRASERPDSPRTADRSHFYHFMRDVHAALGGIKQHADPLDMVAQRLSERTRVICLDEFFVADIADAMILAGLFDGLFRRGVTLVATSNVPPQDLYKDGLQRQRFLPAIELIRTHVEVMHLDGGIDYRLRQLERAPTYMDSRSSGTPAALQERFAALTGAVAERRARSESTLTIEGANCAVMWTLARRGSSSPNCATVRAASSTISNSHTCSTPYSSRIFRPSVPRMKTLRADSHHADRRAVRSRSEDRGFGGRRTACSISRRAP